MTNNQKNPVDRFSVAKKGLRTPLKATSKVAKKSDKKRAKSALKVIPKKAGRPSKLEFTAEENDARQRLLHVAADLFGAKGFDSVSTREIALAAELNISLISYYFGGKLGLYKDVIRSHVVRFTSTIDPDLAHPVKKTLTPETFRQSIKTVVENVFEMARSERSMMNLMEREKIQGMPYARDVFEEVIMPTCEKLAGLVKEAQRQGFVKSELNPYTFFILLFQSVIGYMGLEKCNLPMHRKALNVDRDCEALKKMILDIFLKGITQ